MGARAKASRWWAAVVVVGGTCGSAGCATTRVDDPALVVTISVVGLREDERILLRDQVCVIEGVTDCRLEEPPPVVTVEEPTAKKQKRGKKKKQAAPSARATPPPPPPEARIVFGFRGSLGELRHKISLLPHPGLEARTAVVELSYRGFDNLAPQLTIEEPTDTSSVLTEKRLRVVALVPDVDVASVQIAGDEAFPPGPGRYVGEPSLDEGENEIVVSAVDTAGNVRSVTLHVVVDTTPPVLEVEVALPGEDRALVKGIVKDAETVLINGRPADIDVFGRFSRELPLDPDTNVVEVVATDAYGNVKKIRRSVMVGSAMSDQSN